MTPLTQSYAIRNIISKFWICCKRLDMVRVYLNSFAVAFVVMCAAILAGVIISQIYSLAPFIVFWMSPGKFVLMALWWIGFSFCLIGSYRKSRANFKSNGSERARQRTELSFSAFLFVFRHWLIALRTWCRYLHTLIAYAFSIGFLFALKTNTANKTGFSNTMSVSVEMRSTSPASLYRFFSKQGNAWCLLSTIRAWTKSRLVTRSAYSIITSVIPAYLTSVFHISILPQVANEYNYE